MKELDEQTERIKVLTLGGGCVEQFKNDQE